MNEAQSEAAFADIFSPLLVIAGAGSGKTLTMVRRVEHIVRTSGCRPREILAITFTRAAAEEMKSRLRLATAVARDASKNVVDLSLGAVPVLTIHSFCLRLLRTYLETLNTGPTTSWSNDFSVVQDREQALIVNEALEAFDLRNKAPAPAAECIALHATVEVRGLQKSPETNGRQGQVLGFDESTGRWHIRFLDGVMGLLRRENLVVATSGSASGTSSSSSSSFPRSRGPEEAKAWQLRVRRTLGRLQKARAAVRPTAAASAASSLAVAAEGGVRGGAADLQDELLAFVAAHYEATLKASNALDFHDFVRLATQLLANEDVCREVQSAHKFVLVDEFQDVSASQFELLTALVGGVGGDGGRPTQTPACITVVGDDDQSIYSFQGASVGNFDAFQRRYAFNRVRVVHLDQNFRSSSTIVQVSNAVIQVKNNQTGNGDGKVSSSFSSANSVKKAVRTSRALGEPVVVCECRTPSCELAFVMDELQRRHDQGGVPWRDMAVLYRTNAVGASFQAALRRRQGDNNNSSAAGAACAIPFKVAGEHAFNSLEVDDCFALMRLALFDSDSAFPSVAKVLRAPLPEAVSWELFARCKAKRCSLVAAAQWFLKHGGNAIGGGEKAASGSAGERGTSKGEKKKTKKQNPRAEVKKVLDCYDTLKLRAEELRLPLFVRRVVDCHPWVKKRMQQRAQDLGVGGSTSTSGGGDGGGPNDKGAFGDVGAALVREAELYDAKADADALEGLGPVSDQAPSRSGDRYFPEAPKWSAPAKQAAAELDDDDDDDGGGEAEARRRVARAIAFLDHLTLAEAEGTAPFPLAEAEAEATGNTLGVSSSSSSESQEGYTGGGCKGFGGKGGRSGEPPLATASPGGTVWLGTVHQSKGLEWAVVFVVRFNEEEFPLVARSDGAVASAACDTPGHSNRKPSNALMLASAHALLEEERRLAYVALSRPKQSLLVSYVLQDLHGGPAPAPSRFLGDIPSSLVLKTERFSDIAAESHVVAALVASAAVSIAETVAISAAAKAPKLGRAPAAGNHPNKTPPRPPPHPASAPSHDLPQQAGATATHQVLSEAAPLHLLPQSGKRPPYNQQPSGMPILKPQNHAGSKRSFPSSESVVVASSQPIHALDGGSGSSQYASGGGGGGGGKSGECYKCKGIGHWARDCPNESGVKTGVYSQGGGRDYSKRPFPSSGSQVSVALQPAHAGARGGGGGGSQDTSGGESQYTSGGGGGSGKSGECYKCKGIGHWARDCLNESGGKTGVYNQSGGRSYDCGVGGFTSGANRISDDIASRNIQSRTKPPDPAPPVKPVVAVLEVKPPPKKPMFSRCILAPVADEFNMDTSDADLSCGDPIDDNCDRSHGGIVPSGNASMLTPAAEPVTAVLEAKPPPKKPVFSRRILAPVADEPSMDTSDAGVSCGDHIDDNCDNGHGGIKPSGNALMLTHAAKLVTAVLEVKPPLKKPVFSRRILAPVADEPSMDTSDVGVSCGDHIDDNCDNGHGGIKPPGNAPMLTHAAKPVTAVLEVKPPLKKPVFSRRILAPVADEPSMDTSDTGVSCGDPIDDNCDNSHGGIKPPGNALMLTHAAKLVTAVLEVKPPLKKPVFSRRILAPVADEPSMDTSDVDLFCGDPIDDNCDNSHGGIKPPGNALMLTHAAKPITTVLEVKPPLKKPVFSRRILAPVADEPSMDTSDVDLLCGDPIDDNFDNSHGGIKPPENASMLTHAAKPITTVLEVKPPLKKPVFSRRVLAPIVNEPSMDTSNGNLPGKISIDGNCDSSYSGVKLSGNAPMLTPAAKPVTAVLEVKPKPKKPILSRRVLVPVVNEPVMDTNEDPAVCIIKKHFLPLRTPTATAPATASPAPPPAKAEASSPPPPVPPPPPPPAAAAAAAAEVASSVSTPSPAGVPVPASSPTAPAPAGLLAPGGPAPGAAAAPGAAESPIAALAVPVKIAPTVPTPGLAAAAATSAAGVPAPAGGPAPGRGAPAPAVQALPEPGRGGAPTSTPGVPAPVPKATAAPSRTPPVSPALASQGPLDTSDAIISGGEQSNLWATDNGFAAEDRLEYNQEAVPHAGSSESEADWLCTCGVWEHSTSTACSICGSNRSTIDGNSSIDVACHTTPYTAKIPSRSAPSHFAPPPLSSRQQQQQQYQQHQEHHQYQEHQYQYQHQEYQHQEEHQHQHQLHEEYRHQHQEHQHQRHQEEEQQHRHQHPERQYQYQHQEEQYQEDQQCQYQHQSQLHHQHHPQQRPKYHRWF